MKPLIAMFFRILGVYMLLVQPTVLAQTCPTVNVSLPDTLCQGEEIRLGNLSGEASYLWSLGTSPLSTAPIRTSLINLASLPLGIDYVFDGSKWYGFVTSRTENSLTRIEFGTSITNNNPLQVSLGNVGGTLDLPDKVKIFQEGANWYGLVTNDQAINNLVLLDFGTSLDNTPAATPLGNFGVLNRPRGLDVVTDRDSLIVGLTNIGNSKLVLLNFGSSILNTIEPSDISQTSIVDANVLLDLDLLRDCKGWYGLAVSLGNDAIHKVNFGDTLFREALEVVNLKDSLSTFSAPLGITHYFDGRVDRMYLASSSGLLDIQFPLGLDSIVRSSNFSGTLTSNNIAQPRVLNDSTLLVIDYSTKQLSQYTFSSPFAGFLSDNKAQEPTLTAPTSEGYLKVFTTSFDEQRRRTSKLDSLYIRANSVPTVSIVNDTLLCEGVLKSFASLSGEAITSYSWLIDGVPSGSDSTFNYTFPSSGSYEIALSVTSSNSCTNEVFQNVDIFPTPTASFSTAGSLCSNSVISFNNTTSPAIPNSVISYLWDFGDGTQSSLASPDYTFSTTGLQTIALTATVPGCTDTYVANISLSEGAAISLSYTNNCFADSISLMGMVTSDTVLTRWVIHEDTTSFTATKKAIGEPGSTIDVTLFAESTTGCITSIDQTIIMADSPATAVRLPNLIENISGEFVLEDLTGSDDLVLTSQWIFDNTDLEIGNAVSYSYSTPNYTLPIQVRATTTQGCTYQIDTSLVVKESFCPQPLFEILEDSVCQGETLNIVNNSDPMDFLWVFGDSPLTTKPTRSAIDGLPTTPFGIEYVFDGSNWFGFVTNRNTNELYRLDFGESIENPSPSITSLGNVGGLLDLPDKILILKERGNWFGLVTNDQTSDNLIRLNFGSSLTDSPSASNLGNFGVLNRPRGLAYTYDRDSLIVGLTDLGHNQLVLLNFGSSILNIPNGSDIITYDVPEADLLLGLDLFRDCEGWYGIAVSNSNNIVHKINFGDSLFQAPQSVQNLQDSLVSFSNPLGITHHFDGRVDRLYLVADDNMVEVVFPDGMNGIVESSSFAGDLPSKTLIQPTVVTDSLLLVVDYASLQLVRYTYSTPIDVSIEDPTDPLPTIQIFDTTNTFQVYLTAYDDVGRRQTSSQTVFIRAGVVPTINILSDDLVCEGSTKTFEVSSSEPIDSFAWFVDGSLTTNTPSLVTTFVNDGDYQIRFEGTSDEGCPITEERTTTLFPVPVPSFSVLGSSCTNSEITFNNSTTYSNPDDLITFDWSFGDGSSSTLFSPTYSYSAVAEVVVDLTVTIPGCIISTNRTLDLQSGPSVSFETSNNCIGEPIFLEGMVSNDTISADWIFGSDTTSFLPITSLTGNPGDSILVALFAVSGNGCESSFSDTIIFADGPSFEVLLPSVTENLSASYLVNDLIQPIDSIERFTWVFDNSDSLDGSNVSYTYRQAPGLAPVHVNAQTKQGCVYKLDTTIVILDALFPTTKFSIPDSACIGEFVLPTNQSENAERFFWSVGNSPFINDPAQIGQIPLGGGLPVGAAFAYQGDTLIGFVTNRTLKTLSRITILPEQAFSMASVESLGNPGNLFEVPDKIELVQVDNQWFGLVSNDGGSNNLMLLSFGHSLLNEFTIQSLNGLGRFDRPRGISIIEDAGKYTVLVVNTGNNQLKIIHLGTDFTSITGVPTVDIATLSDADIPLDIDLIKDCNEWIGLVISNGNNKVLKLNFGSNFTASEISASEISGISMSGPTFIELFNDGRSYKAVLNSSSGFQVLDFQGGFAAEPIVYNQNLLEDNFGEIINTRIINDTLGIIVDIASQSLVGLSYPFTFPEEFSLEEVYAPSIEIQVPRDSIPFHLFAIDEQGSTKFFSQSLSTRALNSPVASLTLGASRCVETPLELGFIPVSGSILQQYWLVNSDTISSAQDTSYLFTTPGELPISLVIADAQGCFNTFRDTVQFLEAPTVSFTPPLAPVCESTEYTFSNTSFGAPIDLSTWKWYINEELVSQREELTTSINGFTSASISLVGSIPGCTDSTSTTLSLLPSPSAEFTLDNTCEGDLTRFQPNELSPDNAYFWDFGNGSTSDAHSPSNFFSEPGRYTVSLAVASTNTCQQESTQEITIHALPNANYSYEPICENQDAVFIDESTVPNGNIVAWQWQVEGTLSNAILASSSVQAPSFLLNSSEEYRISLVVESNQGCTKKVEKLVQSIPVPQPIVTPTLACLGESSVFANSTMLPLGIDIRQRQWSINDQFSNGDTIRFSATEADSYEVILTLDYSTGCRETTIFPFEISPLPSGTIQALTTCTNAMATLELTSGSKGAFAISEWQLPNNVTKKGAIISHLFEEAGKTPVSVVIGENEGCIDTVSTTITVYQAPSADMETSSLFGGAPLTVEFINKSTNHESIKWYFGDAMGNTSTENSTSFQYENVGAYTAQLVAYTRQGCSDTSSISLSAVAPILDLSIQSLQVDSTDLGPQPRFILENNGNIIPDSILVQVQVSNQPPFNVILTETIPISNQRGISLPVTLGDIYGDPNSICIKALPISSLAIEDENPENNAACLAITSTIQWYQPFPNPTEDEAVISLVSQEETDITIRIVNVLGNEVIAPKTLTIVAGGNDVSLALGSLPSGIYWVWLITPEGQRCFPVKRL